MKIDSFNQTNFKALYIKDRKFNEHERRIADDISEKLLGKRKPNDKKFRTWNDWLKKEKGIDVYVKRTDNTRDMLTVFGIRNAKNYDDVEKLKNFFVVGEYHTTDFKPEDVMEAYKSEKKVNALSLGTLIFLSLGISAGIIAGIYEKKPEIIKEIPQKIFQLKDSIADSLKITKTGKNIIK